MVGASEAIARLQAMEAAGVEVSTAAAMAMGEVVERAVRAQLSKSSHAPGTPTPSPPGSPPAMISGQLSNSVITKEMGPGHVQVGGTTLYARIQQLGGASGPGGRTILPARPYLETAMAESMVEAHQAAIDVIAEAIGLG